MTSIFAQNTVGTDSRRIGKKKPVLLLKTLSEQIQGELAKICARRQVILLKTLSKQLNAIPMGFSRQKSCIEI